MSVKINLGVWNRIFAVPTKIVDEGLKFSDGVKLKVLLYVLRNCDSELSEEMISKGTGVNVTDIPEALDYWVNLGIFSKEDGDYILSENNNSEDKLELIEAEVINHNNNSKSGFKTNEIKNVDTSEEDKPKQRFAVSKPQKPDYVFTAQRLAVDEELGILVNEAQTVFGKILSNSDASTLLMLKDTCGLPLDVIIMLMQYCLSIGKGNMRTVEKIGIQWADDGIYTLESAENKIRLSTQRANNFSIVSSAFGLKNVGSPTKKQLEYSDKWVGEWKFSPEMLREAYERCVDSKGQMNFRYIDGILKRWYAEGISNTNDLITAEKLTAKKSGKSSSASSIDYSKLNKLSIPDV